jgi:hypothetical protein
MEVRNVGRDSRVQLIELRPDQENRRSCDHGHGTAVRQRILRLHGDCSSSQGTAYKIQFAFVVARNSILPEWPPWVAKL